MLEIYRKYNLEVIDQMVFYTLVLQFYKKMSKRKKKDDTFGSKKKKKTEEKQNSATIMISADGKGTVFPVKLKL